MTLQKLRLRLRSNGDVIEKVLFDEDTGTVLGVTEFRSYWDGHPTEIILETLDERRPLNVRCFRLAA